MCLGASVPGFQTMFEGIYTTMASVGVSKLECNLHSPHKMDKCTSVLLLSICHLSFIVSFVVVVVVVVVLNRLGVKLCIL